MMTTLDRAQPVTPLELMPEGIDLLFDQECAKLWIEVLEELLDESHTARSHHNVGTYDKGCRGPLCRKAHREHPKRRKPHGLPEQQLRAERVYDPILEYYHTVAKYRVRSYRLELLGELA